MDVALAEALFLPWWKGILYILAIAFSIVAVKVTINFDLNEWQKSRKEAKSNAQLKKLAKKCRHMWTLYPNSPLSRCNKCYAFITTSILLFARATGDDKLIILAEYPRGVISQEGSIIVTVP